MFCCFVAQAVKFSKNYFFFHLSVIPGPSSVTCKLLRSVSFHTVYCYGLFFTVNILMHYPVDYLLPFEATSYPIYKSIIVQ